MLRLLIIAVLLAAVAPVQAARPLIGSQVWFAPGEVDQPEDIDRIFRTLAEHQMPVARVSVVWNYMERAPGQWDFSMYDRIFAAAEKHGVRIVATLWPQAKAPFLTGMPHTEAQLKAGERYLEQVVVRYRKSRALDTWLLINEPGQQPVDDPLAVQRFRAWLQRKYGSIERLNRAWIDPVMVPDREPYRSFDEVTVDPRWFRTHMWPVPPLDWNRFWREHLTWYLRWIADRVRALDPNHPLHVNPIPVTANLAARSLDLPSWRPFLDSLGASGYPSATFFLFRPDRFTLAYAYLLDVVRGSIEPKPAWLTEMPGGNITYAQTRSVYPTPRDLEQWLWVNVGGGAERIIFWILNARWKARETGEFGLLDFLGRPSERLRAASAVARAINENGAFFDSARPVESPVTIILSLDAMALQDQWKSTQYPGRDREAHVQCALGFYEALNELGILVRVKHMHDFDWRARGGRPRLVILPHVTALSSAQAADIEAFVRNGNTVLASGLTGFYDLEGPFWPMQKVFPLEGVLGARPKDLRVVGEQCDVQLMRPRLTLPSHLWVADIEVRGAEVIGRQGEWTTAVRHKAGAGETIWIPSPVGLGAWLGDRKPLAALLKEIAAPFVRESPFRFAAHEPGCLMRVMRNGSTYLTVLVNAGEETRRIRLERPAGLTPRILWGGAASIGAGGSEIAIEPKGTVVALWK
ncbi:MAG: beta-galactosidase [Acidobacteriota bacterium]